MAVVPWGEWRPDVADFNGQHSKTIENVYPRGDGYGPANGFSTLTDALPGPCRGFFSALRDTGAIQIFAATATRLYTLNQTDYSWLDISQTDSSPLDLSGESYIGDMTSGGDLDVSFDGTTATAAASCSQVTAATGYVGVNLTTAACARSIKIYGSNDEGFVSSANPSVTITAYGKQGSAPSSSTDGTSLGTVTFTDTADESSGRTITVSGVNGTTRWDYIWVLVDPGSSVTINVAEVEITSATDFSSIPSTDQWGFAQFGSDVVAVQTNVTPQRYTTGSSQAFADLAGSPPQASYVAVVNEFLVLSGLNSNPYRIAWSARSDITGWTAGTDESDLQDFPDGGIVRGVAGGEFGLVFQDSAIRQMIYAPGSAVVFTFDRLSNDMGLRAPLSLVQARERVFFLSQAGFQEWIPGQGFKPIGKERWDRTFFNDWDAVNSQYMMGGTTPRGTRIFWAYRSTGGETDGFDKIIVYDYVLERASVLIGVEGQYLNSISIPGQTLEGLDDVSSSIDELSTPLDEFLLSFGYQISLSNDSYAIGVLSGDTLEATLESPEISGISRRQTIRGQRPICDADTIYGSVSGRQKQSDPVVYSEEQTVGANGIIPHHINTRDARFKNRIPAAQDWNYSIGVEPVVRVSGRK